MNATADTRALTTVSPRVVQLGTLDVQRWGEGDRPDSDEDRTDRAAANGREEGYLSLIEVKLDGVAPQHEIVHRGGAITSRRNVPHLVDDRIIPVRGAWLLGNGDCRDEQNVGDDRTSHRGATT